jgi:hypothetical protein
METKKQSIIRKQKLEEEKFIELAKENNINRYNFTALDCPYDVKMQSGDTYFISETKVRVDRNLEYFEKYGPFLELKKVEGMLKEKERIKEINNLDIQMLYIHFASDGYQIFLLKNPWEYKFTWRFLPKDNYNPEIKIWKLVTELSNPLQTNKKN